MDWTNFAHELFTVFCFVSFLVFAWVAYSKRSKQRYNDVAKMIIDDDDLTPEEDGDEPSGNGAR
ncbi:MAG: cbb3-type cytochrome c oxidase subunit 3 [Paludibacterium sp.]|uniref:cbb3-type cytochrome oxidase subunit 3 n=1 Tax=Paludibacterium sp. TaxID=1917523 RepID=UPI0025F59E49|nr:cbb3-type cytochrome c oxidase subunit 3 [Paludibacterium sp.]MBV8047743.1 cbb3-type cytochrome c oxidase subunit 3 [Paludibacterium sp.]MBV8648075.1 cbb3-type cytochrome c oxidase subunit 3 [Paludibacterium sp.]